MELLFSVSSCLKKLRVDGWPQYGKPLCSVSTRNVVAFTSSVLLNTKVSFREFPEWGGGHVYVVDLDQPWKALRIFGNDEYITALEWDASGSRLLLADVTGKCQCWGMKDFLLNSWTLLGTVEINMEQILALRWFHKGSKITLERDSRDNAKYSDRFKRVPFQPTVAQYGGCAIDGWVAITATGLVSVTLLKPQGQKITLEESLAATRSRIAVCDVAYCNNGELMAAASDGCISSAVSCFNISIKTQQDGNFVLTCLPIASFFLNAYTTNFESCPYSTLSHLSFTWKEGTNSVIASAAGSTGSSVEFWELKEHIIPIHKVFQTSGGATELRKTKWKYVDSVMHTSEVSALVTSHLSPSDSELIPHYTSIVAYKDCSVKLLYRSNVSQLAAVTMENIVRLANDSGLSQSTTAGELTCLRQSTTGYILVGIDSYSQLFVYRLSTSRDTYFQTGTMIAINLIVNLLEYCMLNGYDWFDVLLCVRPNYTDNICEWITENFNKQPASVQQMYCNKFLALKASLFR